MKRWLCVLALTVGSATLPAEEGMWLYNQFPSAAVQKKYGFRVTQEFLDHLRLASLTIGASASFVSPDGLIFTNHHVASSCIQKLSTAGHNYMADGFYASSESVELKCPDSEASQLLRISDVTAQVNGGVTAAAGTPEANQQRRAALAGIENACTARSGNRCEVITLYSGALYHLYEYKRYTDLRLVFAPEERIAFFGGDPDNFTYPRYDLDITFLRAYENGRPAHTPEYLRWSRDGVKDNELAFVSGNPASTDRFITSAQLAFLRDTDYPLRIGYFRSVIERLKAYSGKSAENRRVARDKLFGAENSFKAYTWEHKGLETPKLFEEKKRREDALRAAIEKNPKLKAETAGAWEKIAAAYAKWAGRQKEYYILEVGPRFSDLFRIARNVLRLPEEKAKPNGQRLRDYTDAALPSLERRLYSPAPITASVEEAVLANYFRFMERELGAENATVKAVLAGRSPEQAAHRYVSNSKLQDVGERKRLAASAQAAKESKDGMIELARLLDAPARAVLKQRQDELEAVERANGSRIAQGRFAVYGTAAYPDATSSLRLSYGVVKGYKNDAGQWVPFATDFAGMFRHATGEDPFRLPDSFLKAKDSLLPSVALNFVSTADIIGGNSGSPTVNQKGEIIGIIFDGNLEAMPNRFVYSEVQGRAVHVASQGIIEALRKVYHADRVVAELGFR